ncbi:MAG: aspartate-semialdehyde dehydrogenase, partial [Gammaproteobacteria bacterium]|nr:aspartate-semialdehyde dehydrogenase [Gammaproteobacteria bacterium]
MHNAEKFNIAVVGATGVVGETMLEILAQRNFPIGDLYPLASSRSEGETVRFKGRDIRVKDLEKFDFKQVHIALFSAGRSVSAEHAPRATAAGCIVIDNTSEFRYADDIPLVVPEVNSQDLAQYKQRLIIANPNCSTIQLTVALKPVYDAVGIERINIATYQSVSGGGRKGVENLMRQSVELLNGRPVQMEGAEKQIAFNAVPHIDEFQDNG